VASPGPVARYSCRDRRAACVIIAMPMSDSPPCGVFCAPRRRMLALAGALTLCCSPARDANCAQPALLMPASIELSAPCPRCAPYGRLSAPHYPLRLAAACHRIWLVRTRQVTASARDPALQFWHHGPAGWTPASRAHFLADQDPSLPTVFWVHGNRVSDSGAVNVGMGIGRLLAEHARVPFRFVIWSWPSERICGPLRDVREKAARSDEGAYPLASLIDQIDPAVPISLVGYSYGSRLITGALQLLGGGQLACRCLPYRHNALRVPLRAVLIAGSLDNNPISHRGQFAPGTSGVEQLPRNKAGELPVF
jgi:hypothetical protein